MSNEEFAAKVADNHLESALSVRQRLVLQGLILSTSFGQANPANLPDVEGVILQRNYTPKTDLEKLIAFADIGRFILGPNHHLDGSLKMLEELGNIPQSFDTWLAGEKGFLKYIQIRFDQIKTILGDEGVKFIQTKLDSLREAYDTMEYDRSPEGRGYRTRFAEVTSQMTNI
jgi:hypothetical protein